MPWSTASLFEVQLYDSQSAGQFLECYQHMTTGNDSCLVVITHISNRTILQAVSVSLQSLQQIQELLARRGASGCMPHTTWRMSQRL